MSQKGMQKVFSITSFVKFFEIRFFLQRVLVSESKKKSVGKTEGSTRKNEK